MLPPHLLHHIVKPGMGFLQGRIKDFQASRAHKYSSCSVLRSNAYASLRYEVDGCFYGSAAELHDNGVNPKNSATVVMHNVSSRCRSGVGGSGERFATCSRARFSSSLH